MKIKIRIDLLLLALLLLILNAPLFIGGSTTPLAYRPQEVATGQWWRLFTHPWVHVSAYHFALDASAFLILYATLPLQKTSQRLMVTSLCASGSLLLAALFSPHIATRGLRGLSGAAHGLMALSGLLAWHDRGNLQADRWLGLIGFVMVTLKGIVEVMTGAVVLGSWHLGSVGFPIVETHLGGILGALIAFAVTAQGNPQLKPGMARGFGGVLTTSTC